jgi:hypothetical protein
MRRAVLALSAVLIAGCGAHRPSSPAWPKMAEHETDGGESLAPRQGATAVAAAEAEGPAEDIKVVAAPVAAPAVTPAATPAVTPTITAPEETITVEDIVIEVDD